MCLLMVTTYSNNEAGDQRAKKVVSDSPGLVDFAIGLVNSVLNLPDGVDIIDAIPVGIRLNFSDVVS